MGTSSTRSVIRLFLCSCPPLLATACGADAASRSLDAPRLTVGIEHVRALEPRAGVGLASANSISLASSGRIYIGDGSDRAIKVFAPDGTQGDPIGRAGGGPGEFTTLLATGVLGDSVFAWDGPANRFTMFGPDG